jgi:hypothetical protein
MSRLLIPLQKRVPRFKEIIFLSHEGNSTSDASSSNPRQDGASCCFEIFPIICTIILLIILLAAVFGGFYIYFPFFVLASYPAAAPVLLVPIIFSALFSTIFFVGVVVRGKCSCAFHVGHSLGFGSLCFHLFYIAEWLKLTGILPFEWPILCIPLYVGGGFLLVALIWFLVLYRKLSLKRGKVTDDDINAIIFGIDPGSISKV